jgi:WD40 repeat protein
MKWLVSGGFDETLRVWDPGKHCQVASFQEPARDDGYGGSVGPLSFHPSGNLLAYVTPRDELCIRETETWQPAWDVDEDWDISHVRFSPDGRVLALGLCEGGLCLWDIWGRATLWTVDFRSMPCASAFSPDGALLVVATQAPSIKIIDVATGVILGSLPDPGDRVYAMAFSPDANVLASVAGDAVTLWNTDSWEPLRVIREEESPITAGAMSPDGTLLAWGRDCGAIRLHALAGPNEEVIFKGHSCFVLSLAFSPDGQRLASGGQDGLVLIWDYPFGGKRGGERGRI